MRDERRSQVRSRKADSVMRVEWLSSDERDGRWSREARTTVERRERQGIGVSGERRERKDWSDGVLGRAVRERIVEEVVGESEGMDERESGSAGGTRTSTKEAGSETGVVRRRMDESSGSGDTSWMGAA